MSPLPGWLTPGTFVSDGSTIFAVDRVQQAKPPNRSISLLAGDGSRYPLQQCHRASLGDLINGQRFIDRFGKAVFMSLKGNLVTLSDGSKTAKVQLWLGGIDAAALSLARAFEGSEILDEEVLS
ncbi:MAG: hypothetical protein F6J95_023925 [Leptolyngbya sp. SIO1E4]|nr:hypothetical protein [Leptolyngbya sp. SIO1E4]